MNMMENKSENLKNGLENNSEQIGNAESSETSFQNVEELLNQKVAEISQEKDALDASYQSQTDSLVKLGGDLKSVEELTVPITSEMNQVKQDAEQLIKNIEIPLDDTYVQYDINAFLSSPDNGQDSIERSFLGNYQTRMKKDDSQMLAPYIRSEHNTINGLLRQDKDITIENVLEYKGKEDNQLNREWNADIVDSYKTLENCIENSQFNIPAEGVGSKLFRIINGDHFTETNIGNIVTEKSFLSTSIDEAYKDFYLNDDKDETIITFSFPEKAVVNGIYLGNTEKEFLLPRNMSYRIVNKNITEAGGHKKIMIEAEFLPNEHLKVEAEPEIN